jgi:energy-coupling factor transporter ATP-binding protein EcfA2
MRDTNTMTLAAFLETHAAELADTVMARCAPLYDPRRGDPAADMFGDRLARLGRRLYPVQAEIAKGLALAAYRLGRRRLLLCGEQGCGKTTIALALAAVSDRPQRVLVVCPTHLVEKWLREAQAVIPGVRTADLTVKAVMSRLELLRLDRGRPAGPEVYVLGKERAKLSYPWRPAAWNRPRRGPHCPDCGREACAPDGSWCDWEMLRRRRACCPACGAAWWQADPSMRRMAPVEWMKRRLRGFFDLVVLDEVHELKGGDTLQGRAMGGLVRVAPRTLCLTGTLNGGYADDLFHLLWRLDPHRVKAEGFTATSTTAWLERYGTIEIVRDLEDGEEHVYGRGRKRAGVIRRRPGVSPLAIGRHLLDRTAFIRVADVADGLPPYEEGVDQIALPPEAQAAYRELEGDLRRAVRTYGQRSLGAMLQALLAYPDAMMASGEEIAIRDQDGQVAETVTAPRLALPDGADWPKERRLIELVAAERAVGRKVLVYLAFTGTRDLRPRLSAVLRRAGVRVGTLDAAVEPKRREAWILRHQGELDVLLTNPELVKTGLDLYEFPTVVFYEVGYNLFTLRQAARRSWRIGQTQPVRVVYLAYRETMQAVALELIARKLAAALVVEGELPDGLAEFGQAQASLVDELGAALREGRGAASAEAAWAALRRREDEQARRLDETGRDVGERPTRPVEPVGRGPIDEIGQLALF